MSVEDAAHLIRLHDSHHLSSIFRLNDGERRELWEAKGPNCCVCGEELEWGRPQRHPRHWQVAHIPALSTFSAEELSAYSYDPWPYLDVICFPCNQEQRTVITVTKARPAVRTPATTTHRTFEYGADGLPVPNPNTPLIGTVGLIAVRLWKANRDAKRAEEQRRAGMVPGAYFANGQPVPRTVERSSVWDAVSHLRRSA